MNAWPSFGALLAALAGILGGLWILGAYPELWLLVVAVSVLGCWGAAYLLRRLEDKPGEEENR